jgi:hypothetical protein
VRYLHIMGGFSLSIIAMTFCVILGLFILGRLALYVLKMRICGARFSVARLRETIFAFFVLVLRWFSLLPWRGDERRARPEAEFSILSCLFYFNQLCQLLSEHPYLLIDKYVPD